MPDRRAQPPDDGAPRPARRARYRGTHPRQFAEKYKELDPARYGDIHAHVRAQGRTPAGTHVPVLLAEVLDCLAPQPGETAADCTLGFGGHAEALLAAIGPTGTLIGLDVDGDALARTAARLATGHPNARFHRCHFAGLGGVMTAERLDGLDLVLADLGVSSMQYDNPARGFSYKHAGPLDMRLDDRQPRTAAGLLASLSVAELTAALRTLADEPDAEAIAQAIVRARLRRPIDSTRALSELVLRTKGLSPSAWRARGAAQANAPHPAARTFQALRMLVNDEADGLAQFLRIVPWCLRPGGRVAIISFHDGEDGPVARAFESGRAAGLYADCAPQPIVPGAAERRDNARSRSARLRWARRATTG